MQSAQWILLFLNLYNVQYSTGRSSVRCTPATVEEVFHWRTQPNRLFLRDSQGRGGAFEQPLERWRHQYPQHIPSHPFQLLLSLQYYVTHFTISDTRYSTCSGFYNSHSKISAICWYHFNTTRWSCHRWRHAVNSAKHFLGKILLIIQVFICEIIQQ